MLLSRLVAGTAGIAHRMPPVALFMLVLMWCVAASLPAAEADDVDETQNLAFSSNVGLIVIPREILFFSAQAGAWTSIRLDPGERILRRAASGDVAAVVTSLRAIGFSAPLNVTDEIRVPEEEGLNVLRVTGELATALTRRRALGYSAYTGKWTPIDRFLLGR
jgi:hypothetical protein